ncbi:MAG: FAD-dependent oxidoreductase, partial [Alphaproteobacteria bacterium]
MSHKTVVIIGAGPAGLTAAHELCATRGFRVILLEESEAFGGISRTVNHNGNRIDIGGHRFFSKSDWVMDWWRDILPIQSAAADPVEIAYQNKTRMVEPDGAASADADRVMLVRNRLSRIYYQNKFLSYPVKPDLDTAMKLGPWRIAKIGATYAQARMFPRKPEASLEDFLLNRFGRELYETFFHEYTEKVWGVPCAEISAEWGAQRIKGLSLSRAAVNALTAPLRKLTGAQAANTSLIERFLYPKYGPGQLWETVAEKVARAGVEIRTGQKAVQLHAENGRIVAVVAADAATGERRRIEADYVLSSMPVLNLIAALGPAAPAAVQDIAFGLEYRDFITVGLLLDKLKPSAGAIAGSPTHLVPDNWIYIQDRGVDVG